MNRWIVEAREHSAIGASSTHRWMNCLGSTKAIRNSGIIDVSSVHAERGTAAHELGERCLANHTDPVDYLNDTVIVVSGNEYPVDQSMVDAVTIYVNYCRSIVNAEPCEHGIEREFNLDWVFKTPPKTPTLWGMADFYVFRPWDRLIVVDYKNGTGVTVDPEENPQFMFYALGVLGPENLYEIETVELVVVQPNGGGSAIKTWETTPEHLYEWAKELASKAEIVLNDPDAPLCPGHWCKDAFCPLMGTCGAVLDLANRTAVDVFDGYNVAPQNMAAKVDEIAPAKLHKIIALSDLLVAFAKAAQARAFDMLKVDPTSVPGLKLVEGRASRSWTDESAVMAELANKGVDMYSKPKLKTPAQMETAVKKAGFDPNTLAGFIEVKRGLSMVPESDKRQAVTVADKAFDEFTD